MDNRIIFHIDVNNAFLSWSAVHRLEQGEKLDIRSIPSVIGFEDQVRKGIVLAKSTKAKEFKIITGEPIYQARKKCPSLKVYPPDYYIYEKKSNEMFEYLKQYSPNMEKYSIDECFIDFTQTSYLYSDYHELANKIKEEIYQKFKFTVNIGIGNNKLCAKMASDFLKPDRVHTLYKEEIPEKMWKLPIEELFMCGKQSSETLRKLSINTIGDLAKTSIDILFPYFKNQASQLIEFANGIDDSSIGKKISKNESISTSKTLTYDVSNIDKIKEILLGQIDEVSRKLRLRKKYAYTVGVIFKTNTFQSFSYQTKLNNATNQTKVIYKEIIKLFESKYKGEVIRLIGVRLANFTTNQDYQITLFDKTEDDTENDKIQTLIDSINNKYNSKSITYAFFKKDGK